MGSSFFFISENEKALFLPIIFMISRRILWLSDLKISSSSMGTSALSIACFSLIILFYALTIKKIFTFQLRITKYLENQVNNRWNSGYKGTFLPFHQVKMFLLKLFSLPDSNSRVSLRSLTLVNLDMTDGKIFCKNCKNLRIATVANTGRDSGTMICQ